MHKIYYLKYKIMIGTVPVNIDEYGLASANYAIAEYVMREDSSHSTIVQNHLTSYREKNSKISESSKNRKLSNLSGLFDFQNLDEEYFKEKGF